MNLKDFHYDLPQELIAQTPAVPRDSSRLLVYDKHSGHIEHKHFFDIVNYLNSGDVLVVNNTKVLPARLIGQRPTGAKIEILLLKRVDYRTFEALVKPGKKARVGDVLVFSPRLSCEIVGKTDAGGRVLRFEFEGVFEDILSQVGSMPLPHYIKQPLSDGTRYQTVYSRTEGSGAAPTAGLHFTPELIKAIVDKGIIWTEVLLHVGLGTFRPVKTQDITKHEMHSEYYEVSPAAAETINTAKREGRRIVAVGTTSVRVLESACRDGRLQAGSGETNIFIYPGYKFCMPDKIITNFHLPESTLIMLVSAFLGREQTLELYRTAIEEKYRFFSFGDAMLI